MGPSGRSLGRALMLACALALAGCGNPTVAACERWLEALLELPCGPEGDEIGVDCRDYEDYPCDASPYFECLERSYSCSETGDFVTEPNACASAPGC